MVICVSLLVATCMLFTVFEYDLFQYIYGTISLFKDSQKIAFKAEDGLHKAFC
jgi:hypothetical protein